MPSAFRLSLQRPARLLALAALALPLYASGGYGISRDELYFIVCGERWWLIIGAVAGLALLSKYMLAFWLMGLGILATPARRSLAHP
jgi:4-amino-4-deoxy-L-arabinose transferase-like glycosyltransferase